MPDLDGLEILSVGKRKILFFLQIIVVVAS